MSRAKKLRTTKLGVGSRHVPPPASNPPPPFSCPAPRVPTFDVVPGNPSPPPPTKPASASGIRRSWKQKVPRALGDAPASLDALDAFVLARIDGTLTLAELGDLLEMPSNDLDPVIVRLVELGLVDLV